MKIYHVLLAVLVSAVIAWAQPDTGTAFMSDSVDRVKAIAEEITVLIPETNPNTGQTANGSGFLIAKEGNTYTVLTANHVVCRDNLEVCNQPRPGLKVVTHDGRESTLDFQTVKKLPGVDLAILKFNSNRTYPVATLATYDMGSNSERTVQLPNGQTVQEYVSFVFASGWPGINGRDITELKYRFSVGKLLPPDRMIGFKIRPVSEGYEAVYTSITYPGMSGGPVLDTDGRVIAVHGQNEGERVYSETSQRQVRVQIGYSLSIPITHFLKLAPQAGISLNQVTVQTNRPRILNDEDWDAIGTAYVLAGIQEQTSSDPNSEIYWANQGNQYWRALKTKEALESYEKALNLNPEFYPVWYGRGLVKTFLAEYNEAFDNYSKAIEILDQQIAKLPRKEERQEIRGWVMNLQNEIQHLVTHSPSRPMPTVNSPPPQIPPNSTVQPSSPPTSTDRPVFSPTEPGPDPELLW